MTPLQHFCGGIWCGPAGEIFLSSSAIAITAGYLDYNDQARREWQDWEKQSGRTRLLRTPVRDIAYDMQACNHAGMRFCLRRLVVETIWGARLARLLLAIETHLEEARHRYQSGAAALQRPHDISLHDNLVEACLAAADAVDELASRRDDHVLSRWKCFVGTWATMARAA
jgi:hypothetical protein